MQRQQSESRDPESRSEMDPPLNELVLISTGDGKCLTSVNFVSDLPSPDESRDPHGDGRIRDVHAHPTGGEFIDVSKICQEMEQAMEQRLRRLDETWNQIPRIMEQLQRHVEETKNMDSSIFQIGNRSILANDEAETAMTMFSIDEALNLTASANEELDMCIEASFPNLCAYVNRLESTSISAIAELLADDEIGPLTGASSQETVSSSQSCTEGFFEDPVSLPELSFTQNNNAKSTWTQTCDTEESVPACIMTVGRTHQPLAEQVTTSEPAFTCRHTCVESPTIFVSRDGIHSQERSSLMKNEDNDDNIQTSARCNLESVSSCRHHITMAGSLTTSILKEDIGVQSKLILVQSEDKSLNIHLPSIYTAEWEGYSLAPSDETANSTQSCTERLSLTILWAELYCQEVNFCFENADDGLSTQNDLKLSTKMPATEPNCQTSQDFTWSWQTSLHDLTLLLSQMLDDLNTKWEHACLSCDRCLSIVLTGSLPAPS